MKRHSAVRLAVICSGSLLFTQVFGSADGQTATALPPPVLVGAGRDFVAWARSDPSTNATTSPGQTRYTHRIVQVASGMNHWDGSSLQWVRSDPSFQINNDGSFVADTVAHPVRLANNLNSQPAVSILTPGGHLIQSTPVAIVLYDSASGQRAVIATVTNSAGVLVNSNVVVFDRAFDRVCASVV
jgi:hypothetical protein